MLTMMQGDDISESLPHDSDLPAGALDFSGLDKHPSFPNYVQSVRPCGEAKTVDKSRS